MSVLKHGDSPDKKKRRKTAGPEELEYAAEEYLKGWKDAGKPVSSNCLPRPGD